MYDITPYTKAKAKQLNVIVKPSTRKGKKRHSKDRSIKNTAGYFADRLLW